jgi:hypothetical protein
MGNKGICGTREVRQHRIAFTLGMHTEMKMLDKENSFHHSDLSQNQIYSLILFERNKHRCKDCVDALGDRGKKAQFNHQNSKGSNPI